MRSEFPHRTRPHSQAGPQRARAARDAGDAPLLARAQEHRVAVEPLPSTPVSSPRAPTGGRMALLWFVRHGIAITVALAGVVAMALGTDTSLVGGAGLIGAAIAIWLVGWLYRVGVRGDRARDEEDRARRHFERHGRWPDERGGVQATRR